MAVSSTVDPDKVIEIEPPISVKKLSEAMGAKVNALVAMMTFKLDIKGKTINSFLSEEEVELVAMELDRNVKIVETKEAEEELIESLVEQTADITQDMRAPVVTFMGHVDHGKTTLLDALRGSDVAITSGEAGGITQHIGAYKITMRSRGATITDVVVLVVAADDGVMPQTEEAIAHAKEANVPIVVAVNKCDLPGARPEQVRQQLAVKGLQSEEWGGEVGFVDVSAVTGDGLTELMERILLEAEVAELAAKPLAPASGVVIESRQSAEQGIVVNALVMDGTLRVKDQVICGESYSRVRGITDDHGQQVEAAGPATPVSMLGLDKLPQPGDKFFAVADTKKAKEVIEDRQRRARTRDLAERTAVTIENIGATIAAQAVSEIKVILKADVMGSLEPIKASLAEIANDEVRFNIIHSALGAITETDVTLAAASSAIIIGFNTVPDATARQIADRTGVEIRFYDIIYNLIDEMKLALEGLLKPDEIETVHGQAEVRAVFKSSKFGNIAGCFITDGSVNRNSRTRLLRDGAVVHTGGIGSLRRVQDDVREVKAGFECGLTISNFSDVKEGDELTFYVLERVKRKLE
jgi:translation initiation factor IF-2